MRIREAREKIAGYIYYTEEIIEHLSADDSLPDNVIKAIEYLQKNKDFILQIIREENAN